VELIYSVLKKPKFFTSTFPKATVTGFTAASDPDRQQQPRSYPAASTVPMSWSKSQTLELLAFGGKSTFDCFSFIWAYKARLALYFQIKQKQSKVYFHRSSNVRYARDFKMAFGPPTRLTVFDSGLSRCSSVAMARGSCQSPPPLLHAAVALRVLHVQAELLLAAVRITPILGRRAGRKATTTPENRHP
jgi:hypothetical protein